MTSMARLGPLALVVLVLILALAVAACGNGVVVAEPTPTVPIGTVPIGTVPIDTVPIDTVPTDPVPTGPPPTQPTATQPTATTLPDPASLPRSASGEFEFAVVAGPGFEIEGVPMIEFAVAVEEGSGVDIDEFSDLVIATLSSRRSWGGRGTGFRLVDNDAEPLFTLVVATPDTVDELCLPLDTGGIFSCARNGWIALNLLRWETATEEWPADLVTYRRYLINHEVGHYILGPGHDSCPGAGQPAPIMMQQTKGLDGCTANGWVDP